MDIRDFCRLVYTSYQKYEESRLENPLNILEEETQAIVLDFVNDGGINNCSVDALCCDTSSLGDTMYEPLGLNKTPGIEEEIDDILDAGENK